MTEKPLRLKILEYLIANDGLEEFIDINTPFINSLSDLEGRGKYVATLERLITDKHVEVRDSGYGIMNCLNAGLLRPIDEIKINARITLNGYNYIQEKNKKSNTINVIIAIIGLLIAALGVYSTW